MTLLKKVALSAAAVAALCVIVGLFLPRTAHVERSITIDASPATLFTILNGFARFNEWSPWADADPGMRLTLEGPAAGPGAKMSWSGNAEVGSGSQEILASTPYSSIRIKLVFGDFGGDFFSTYDLVPDGRGTRLTWSFDADYGGSLVGRYFGLLSDRMIGPDYEKGLARLKALAEPLPKVDFARLGFETVEVAPQAVVLLTARSANNPNAIGVALGVAYSRLSGFMSSHGVRQVAPPLAIFHGEESGALKFDAALPIDRDDVAASGAIRVTQLRGGPAVRAIHRGPYAGLGASHATVAAYLDASGLERDGPYWEQYVSDPGSTPEGELITHLYYPIKQGS